MRMKYVLFSVFAAVTLWLTLNLHSRTGVLTYKSEIYSDKAGYYIYLPAAFIYGFDGAQVPDSLPAAAGGGFEIDAAKQKIFTKYPMGTAIMEAPFFVVTHYLIAPVLGEPATGFSKPYHTMIDIAAWIYLLLGILLMAQVLKAYFSSRTVYISLLLTYLGTNLFYYQAVESGMSHVYSFFLVAALLRLTQIIHQQQRVAWIHGLAIGTVLGLLVITRFTNALALSLLLLWEIGNFVELKARLRMLLTWKAALPIFVMASLFIGLQASYYSYLTGSPWMYAYKGESFDFAHSQWFKVWFSPQNGLFLHAPMMLFALLGCGLMWHRQRLGAAYLMGLFVVLSYVFGAWWQWYFGCAYGARSFVEYLPLFGIGLGYLVEWVGNKPRALRIASYVLLAVLSLLCFKNGYMYKLCYLGLGEWDFGHWWQLTTAI